MKQKDIVSIIVVMFVSGALSLGISSVFISPPEKRITQVEVVEKITPDFPEPDKKYFNPQSLNPTQLITIGTNTNTTPFNAPAQ